MNFTRRSTLAAFLAACSLGAAAQTPVKVEDAWVRGTVPRQQATGAFMRLTAERNIRLVAATSPLASVVEIHEMVLDNDVMKMRQIPGLALAAGRTTELKPGGWHIMLMALKAQVKAGESVPISLVFEDETGQRFRQDIVATATALGTPPAGMPQHKH